MLPIVTWNQKISSTLEQVMLSFVPFRRAISNFIFVPIIDSLGVLKLTDFGFAKETHVRDTLQTPCYTPYYVGKSSFFNILLFLVGNQRAFSSIKYNMSLMMLE